MPKVIVSFSGGKDSTWMLLEMIRRGEHIDEVVFFDSGWEFPQMIRHVEKIKSLVETHGITFTTLHPKNSFDYLMFDKPHRVGDKRGWSWCGYGGGRWGTREKISTIDSYFKTEPEYIQCIGIAVDESERLEKEYNQNKRFPLVEWNVTEAECLQGCYSLGYDWEGLYEDLDRVSCKFCAFKNLKELRNIYFKMPDVWTELRDYQTRTHLPYKGSQGSVFDLEVRFELEKEFEAQGKSIRSREFFDELKKRLGESEGTI
jgi:3'-phosphoadenosine 5'-phosphosulfate sulfotransferase (PAPS reductase)/FAD synthetase